MLRSSLVMSALGFAVILLCSCSGGIDTAPTATNATLADSNSSQSSHFFWGLWQFTAHPETGTLDIAQLREGNFHLNALHFLEPPPFVNLTLESLEFTGNIIDADIGLRHPFLGLTEFTGFDVCGIFITVGSITGFDDPSLRMAGQADTHLLNPDGYSRWWNPAEFPVNNGTMFSYKDGLLGTKDSSADFNSTINGYKYYCDDLGPNDPPAYVTLSKRGMFSAGKKNIRHYTIELGNAGLVFNYAVDACWAFPTGNKPWTAPDDFPPEANRAEAWRVEVTEVENTLWNDGTESGGDLVLSIDVYDWFNAALNAVKVESPGNFPLVASTTPESSGEGYCTYKIEILDANPAEGAINLLISVESEAVGYGDLLPGKPVTAFFSYSAEVLAEPVNPVCDLKLLTVLPGEGWDFLGVPVEFDASGSYDPAGGSLSFKWDFNNDGIFGDGFDTGTDDMPVKIFHFTNQEQVCVQVSNDSGGKAVCCVPVDIIAHKSKNIPLRGDVEARDLTVDPVNGNLLILYSDFPDVPPVAKQSTVYKYLPETYYTEPSVPFYTNPSGSDYSRLTVSSNEYTAAGGPHFGCSGKCFVYDPEGTLIGPLDWVMVGPSDILFLNTGGNFPYDAILLYGLPPYFLYIERSLYPTYPWWSLCGGPGGIGVDRLAGLHIRGAESAVTGDYFWAVKDPGDPGINDYYGSRWLYTAGGAYYDSAFFGTGERTDSDDGWYDAKDLTRDPYDHLLVLDKLPDGNGRVKAFTASGTGGEWLGGFDIPQEVSSIPVRIDCGDWVHPDWGNLIFILHGNATDGFLLSIYFPGELPW